jgi:hypothetical protein
MPNFIGMISSKKRLISLILLFFCILIKWFSTHSGLVETAYTSGFFIQISLVLRKLLGWIPFSIGDIFYGFVAAWLLYKMGVLLFFLLRKKKKKELFFLFTQQGYRFFNGICIIYIVFNILWGINYNRKGISWQLDLSHQAYTANELMQLNDLLVSKVNETKLLWLQQNKPYPGNDKLFASVSEAYGNANMRYHFLQYHTPSIKPSLWGWYGNYSGFTGYYNPFTGEAQINTTVPPFLHPFISCHEVAHQIGYAKEMEANFVGYLAASSSPDPLFQYSAYLDLFLYANRNLYDTDSAAARTYRKRLIMPVKTDIKTLIRFGQDHRGMLEPVLSWFYEKYLQSNQQPQGIMSYDEVTGLLIAYHRKYGKI